MHSEMLPIPAERHLLPVGCVSPLPSFCHSASSLCWGLSFFWYLLGQLSPRCLDPNPWHSLACLDFPTSNTIIPAFLTLEEIHKACLLSTLHLPRQSCLESYTEKAQKWKLTNIEIPASFPYPKLCFSISCQLSSRGQCCHCMFGGHFLEVTGAQKAATQHRSRKSWHSDRLIDLQSKHSAAPSPLLFLIVCACLSEAPLSSKSFSGPCFSFHSSTHSHTEALSWGCQECICHSSPQGDCPQPKGSI